MLNITIASTELFNNLTNEFIPVSEKKLKLEYSLFAISKWESKFHKSFFTKVKKTREELLAFIRFMDLDEETDPIYYSLLTKDQINAIVEYMNDPMTGRSPAYKSQKKNINLYTTVEDIYYSMAANGIPFECEKWNFNRLQALLRYCNNKNSPDNSKMSMKDTYAMYSDINAARRKALKSKG